MRHSIVVSAVVFAVVLAAGVRLMAEPTWCSQNPGAIFCHDFDRNCVSPPADPNETCPDGSSRSDPKLRGIWEYTSWNVNTQSKCGSNMCGEEVPDSPIPGVPYDYILPSHPYGGRHANGGDEGGSLGQNTVDLTDYILEAIPGRTLVNGSDDEPLVLTFTMGSLALGAMQFNNGYMELSLDDPTRWNTVDEVAKAPTDWVLVGGGSTCLNCSEGCPSGTASQSKVAWPTICQQEFPHSLCPPKQTFVRNAIAVGALALLDNNPCHCCAGSFVPNANQPWRSRCPEEARNSDFPDGWQEPTNVHLSYFDGLEWRVLRAGMGGPGGYGDFRYGNYWIYWKRPDGVVVGNTNGAWETVVLTIKTSTVDIYHKTKMVNDVGGQWVETWAESLAKDLPRYYTGSFNRLRAGTDEACRLNNDTYTCNPVYSNGHRRCKVMKEDRCDGGNATYRSSYVAFDNVRLSGGEGNLEIGACCTPTDGGCTETDPITCVNLYHGTFRGRDTTCDPDPSNATLCKGACCRGMGTCEDDKLSTQCAGGVFKGAGTTCADADGQICGCGSPFADADWDGDVDQIDFAVFQNCFSPVIAVSGLCKCFDRYPVGPAVGDSVVDVNDLEKFELCASGPGVPLDPNCDQ